MATPRTRATGDARSARTQLKTADQTARVGKDTRAVDGPAGVITVALGEKEFKLAENVGIMPLMEWAAASDVDVASADGLRAVYYVLQDTVHVDDWAEFRKHSREQKLTAEDLLDFANSALEALAGRPTEDADGSSDGS